MSLKNRNEKFRPFQRHAGGGEKKENFVMHRIYDRPIASRQAATLSCIGYITGL
jgi:hypothetical protein